MSKPICVLQAPLWTRSGYGDWGLAVAKSLLRYDKFDLRIIPTRWGHCSKKNLEDEIKDEYGQQLLQKILRGPLSQQPNLFIQLTIPNEFLLTPNGFQKIGQYNIGMTAGIETTVPAPEWLEGLNRMDLNIVTSQHALDVFKFAQYNKRLPDGQVAPLKVETPMEVLFWGADTELYKKTDVIPSVVDTELADVKENFVFLFVGQWTGGSMNADRKAIGFLIKTFLEAFKNTKGETPALIIKTSGPTLSVMDKYECIMKIREVTELVKREAPDAILPNVYLLHGELSDVEMNALYNHPKVKVHVSYTHGEGFGHPLLLSTLSGKPLITSHWSGHLDFLNPKYCKFFEGSLEAIPDEAINWQPNIPPGQPNGWFLKDSKWFNVDYTKATFKMQNAFNNYNSFLADAEFLRKENEEKFSVKAMDVKFHALLDQYVPKFAVPQTLQLPKLKKIELPKFKSSTKTDAASPEPLKYHSQYGQDQYLNDAIFKGKKNGVFVDIGAYDGVTCSNTYFFEKNLGWTGVCFEPIPDIYKKLDTNRKCTTLHACGWKENTKKVFRVVEGESDMLSGLVDQYSPEHAERVQRDGKNIHDIEIECLDVNEVLSKDPVYQKIDLLSLDTEGGELEILKHIDFDKYDIKVILVENQYNPAPIRDFLKTKGYGLSQHIQIDDVFVKTE